MWNTKFNLFVMVLFFYGINGCSQAPNFKVTDENGREKLLGIINKDVLLEEPFQGWFSKNYANYKVAKEHIQLTQPKLNQYKIKVFMGTWCGDSRREIPRFYKILEAVNFPMDRLSVVAVDYVQPNYKKSPGGEEKGLNIIKVPTFIFFKNGKEVNRIIEFPVASLEQDMADIVNGKMYVPNYSNMPVLPTD